MNMSDSRGSAGKISNAIVRAEAFAPASVANVAVGFDILGFSFAATGDRVTVERIETPEVQIESVSGLGVTPSSDQATALPTDPRKNTATAGLVRLIEDLDLPFGFRVSIVKGIPFGSGMGGSAASAVAGIVAANALLPRPLSQEELISYALIGEAQASGSYHADNIAPSLLGGLVLASMEEQGDGQAEEQGVQSLPRAFVRPLPAPSDIRCVVVHPQLKIETKTARGILKAEISLRDHIRQSAYLAHLIAGCFTNDVSAIRRSLRDVLIEPQRAHLIPGFAAVKSAALAQGAMGCSISGAGPCVFAWVDGSADAPKVQTAMESAFRAAGVEAQGWTLPLKSEGARVLSTRTADEEAG